MLQTLELDNKIVKTKKSNIGTIDSRTNKLSNGRMLTCAKRVEFAEILIRE